MAKIHFLDYEGLKNYTTKFLKEISSLFAKVSDLNAHKSDSTSHTTSTQKSQLTSAYNHSTSAHAPSNAQKNQNAFSNIAVGSTTIAADTATDTLTMAGSNVTLTPDATNDKLTIGITKANVTAALGYTPPTTDTKYTHPSYTARSQGLYKTTVDSTGHVSAVAAVTKADITALGIPGQDTTYGAAGSGLGLVKSGGDVTISGGVITVNDDSHNHTIANVDGLQTALNGKAPSSHGRHIPDFCTTVTDWNAATTTGWYMASNATNAPAADVWYYGEVIAHNANYVRQILYRFATDSNVAGTGNDRYERVKHNGTWGKWVNTSVRVAVPANAKFTDTIRGVQNNLTSDSTTDALTAAQGKVLKGLVDGKAPSNHTHSSYVNQNAFSNIAVGSTTISADTATDTLTLAAGSNVTITPDATNDKITIAAKDTTYGAATTSVNGLMTAAMVTKLNGIATGANKYTLPTAAKDVLGGVKTSSTVTSASGYTACPIISGIPYYKDTNTTYNLGSFGITATANELNCTKGATSNLQTQINTINSTLSAYWSKIYPIGAIYISTSSANPSTFLGGTWIAWGSGRVPVGFHSNDGNFNVSEKTGGSKTINVAHSHTVNGHSHTVNNHTHGVGSMYAAVDAASTWIGVSRVGGKAYNCDVYTNTPVQGKSYTANFGARLFGDTAGSAPGTSSASPGTNSQLSGSQSILPPYITCYMWKRTA